jgi:parvulin-like peptidyl-prolyl isomerase
MDGYRTKYVLEMLKDVNWEETAQETYRVEKDRYRTEETVNASHILIKVEDRSDEEALALAQELQQRAKKGESFEELATQYSEDPSASGNAGHLGFFKRGQMVKPFDDVVFEMQEPGDISEVVQSPFGYHVIQYHDRKAPKAIPFASVKDQLVKELQTKMSQQVWQDKVIAIRSSRDIVLNEKLLLELKTEYASPSVPQ